jgi:hypothetical protein
MRLRTHVCTLALVLVAPAAWPQSEDVSQVSAISVAPSAVAAGAGLSFVIGVGELTVLSLERTGEIVVATVRATADAVAFTIELSAATVATLGIAVGTTLEASATAAGWIVSCAGEAVAFVPNAAAAAMIHHHEIG